MSDPRHFNFLMATPGERTILLNALMRVMLAARNESVILDVYRKEHGCGTIGCLLGHAMTDPELIQMLNIVAVQSTDIREGEPKSWLPAYADHDSDDSANSILGYTEVFGQGYGNIEISRFLFGRTALGPQIYAWSPDMRFATERHEALGRILLLLELNESGSIDTGHNHLTTPELDELLRTQVERLNAEAQALIEGGTRAAAARFDPAAGYRFTTKVHQQVRDQPCLRYGQALVNALKESGHVRYPVPAIFYSEDTQMITGWFWTHFVGEAQ